MITEACYADTADFISGFVHGSNVNYSHEYIYWLLHEEVYVYCCMWGMEPEQASRKAHIYAIQNTHQVYLEQYQ